MRVDSMFVAFPNSHCIHFLQCSDANSCIEHQLSVREGHGCFKLFQTSLGHTLANLEGLHCAVSITIDGST